MTGFFDLFTVVVLFFATCSSCFKVAAVVIAAYATAV
jgi:hypothetical protein